MNKIYKFGLLSALALFSYSCGDDFLEDPALEGSASLTSAQLEQAANVDPEVINGLISGVYSLTFTTGTGGTTGHDDFGHKSYDVFSDMLSGDMALSTSTYGWYRSSITEFQGPLDFTYGDNRQVWRYYYRIIRGCNEVIDGLVVGYPVKIGSEKHYYLILVLLSRAYRADADNTVSLCS